MVLTYCINHTRFAVDDLSYVGTVRREIKAIGKLCGFDETQLDKLSRVSTELATNLVKHAGRGEILASPILTPEGQAIDLVSIDSGPGIEDTENALKDGYSTCGTYGGGLGAMQRVASRFEISSIPGKGTAIFLRVPASPPRSRGARSAKLDVGALCTPHPRESVSGDTVCFAFDETLASVLVVDALGHGREAFESAAAAAEVFRANPFGNPENMIGTMNRKLSGMRGIALALACFDLTRSKVEFVGVGNINARIYSGPASQGLCSGRGTVGSNPGSLKLYEYDWPRGSAMLLFSDGITSDASIKDFREHSAPILASRLYCDHRRNTDDATVVVLKDLRS